MPDERLRELERRWRATRTLDDRRAYLRERLRVHDRPADRLRLSLLEYDPAVVRADLTPLLQERVAALVGRRRPRERDPSGEAERDPAVAWKLPIVKEVDELLAGLTGPWFEGLGRGFGMEQWCSCHRFFGYREPPRLERLPGTVDEVLAHLDRLHRFHTRLVELCDELALPEGDPGALQATMREAMRRIIDLVVVETGCDDAWYVKPSAALSLFLADKDVVLPDAHRDELEALIEQTFASWVAPSDADVAVIADAAGLAMAWARFEARYGGA